MGSTESRVNDNQSMDVGGQHVVNLSYNSDIMTIGVLVLTLFKIMEMVIFVVRSYNKRVARHIANNCGICQRAQQQRPPPSA